MIVRGSVAWGSAKPAAQAPWISLSSPQQELLKWLAALTMTLDHANQTLWPLQSWAFAVGRLDFSLFVFLIAYNLTVRCVPARRYLLPLLGFSVVSQLPVMIALGRSMLPLNILTEIWRTEYRKKTRAKKD